MGCNHVVAGLCCNENTLGQELVSHEICFLSIFSVFADLSLRKHLSA